MMKKFLGILVVLLLFPLAYLYAEKNLTEVQAQWIDYQSTIVSSEDQLTAGIYDNQSNSLQGNSAGNESQNSIEGPSENHEDAIIDSKENDVSDNVAVNTESIDNVTNNSPDISTTENASVDNITENMPEQVNGITKYSVDTILGGTGKGVEDGAADKAKISHITDMIVDRNNNVFFIEFGGVNIYSVVEVLRKFDTNNNVTTYLIHDDEEAINKMYEDNEDLMILPDKLLYNYDTNKLYVLGKNSYSEIRIYDVSTDFSNSVVAKLDTYANINLFSFINAGTILTSGIGINSMAQMVDLSGKIETYENLLPKTDTYIRKTNCLPNDANSFYLLTDSGYDNVIKTVKAKLEYVQIFPRDIKEIEIKRDIYNPLDIKELNGYFYVLNKEGIHKISTDGKTSVFLDFDKLIYNDSKAGTYSAFCFDNQGNVLLFDDKHYSIRRVYVN